MKMEEYGSKNCGKCQSVKSINDFGKDKNTPDGLKRICKFCRKTESSEYYNKNLSKIKKDQKNYRLNNKESFKEKSKIYRNNNKEKIKIIKKEYSYNNKEKIKEYQIINKDRITERRKEYYLLNKEESNQRSSEYKKANRDKINKYMREYLKNKYKNDINFKLAGKLRTRLNQSLKSKPGSAVRDLGCSIEEFKLYLESKFQPGMTWENYGKKGWHIDHIKPLVSFNLTDLDQFKIACHYTNLQPLWALDNLKKGGKV